MEGPRPGAGEVGAGVGNERGLADGGGPGIEQHVERRSRENGGKFAARLVGSQFFDANWTTGYAAEDFDLFALRERFRSGEHVVLAGVCGVVVGSAEGAHGNGGDIALVNRSRGRRKI